MNNCAFCDQNIDIQEVMKTDFTKIIYPHRPVVTAAVMIMPIRHCENIHDLSQDEVVDMFSVIGKMQSVFKKLHGCDAYNLFANNGAAAGQHVPHVHFHLFGRSKDEQVSPFSILNGKELYMNLRKLDEEEMKKRISEIESVLEK